MEQHPLGEPGTKTEPQQNTMSFHESMMWVLLGLAVIITVKFLEFKLHQSWSDWGLLPRTLRGLAGIITMPFLHKDYEHLFGNCFALFVLGLTLFHFYPRVALRVIFISALSGATLVWLFARPAYHIGASGVVYSLSAFLFLSGVLRRDRGSRGAALIVALLYGGEVWGIFPLQEGVSWEGHLCGAIAGCYLALLYRGIDLPEEPEEEEEPEEDWEDPENPNANPWAGHIVGHD